MAWLLNSLKQKKNSRNNLTKTMIMITVINKKIDE